MSTNDFVTLSKIGQGSYSSVLKVKRISDGNIYALKKVKLNGLKDKEKQNALNEVRLLASISNEFIIGYKEAFFDDNDKALCIVMQYADGGDLQKYIQKQKKVLAWVDEKQVWQMIRQVLTGLSALHEMKIIHRDIKCANIFINAGNYKLGDLNVSKILKKNLAYTQTGTPYYASPEVWKDQPYQLKSDIWSLGCIIYELCAFKPPFTASSMQGLYKKILKGSYARIPQSFSKELQNFIAKCLKLNPAERLSAKQLLKLIPDQSENRGEFSSNINLLNTIKVPFNLKHLKEELPKSNYQNERQKDANSRFQFVSQKRLKQIVKLKQEETFKLREDKKVPNDKSAKQYVTVDKRYQQLPKIKVYSQPSDQILMCKKKDDDKLKKYGNYYYRPVWWG